MITVAGLGEFELLLDHPTTKKPGYTSPDNLAARLNRRASH
jgi:hypothetical protein